MLNLLFSIGAFGVRDLGDEDDDVEADGGEEKKDSEENGVSLEDSEEEVFNGFPDSDDSESD